MSLSPTCPSWDQNTKRWSNDRIEVAGGPLWRSSPCPGDGTRLNDSSLLFYSIGMITLLYPYQNHSNRLIQNLHFQAFCMENNISYCNPSLHDISHLYQRPADTRSGASPSPGSFDLILLFQQEKSEYPNRLLQLSHLNCAVGGWGFRMEHFSDACRSDLVSAYSLRAGLYEDLLLYRSMMAAREQGRLIIGIHIRRGDYRQWSEGRYFFEDSIYARVIREMREQAVSQLQKDCLFVVFSDEAVTLPPDENLMISAHRWYEDHVLMGLCDYVVGPPSTFSIWACFIGGAKLLHLRSAEQPLRLADFAGTPAI